MIILYTFILGALLGLWLIIGIGIIVEIDVEMSMRGKKLTDLPLKTYLPLTLLTGPAGWAVLLGRGIIFVLEPVMNRIEKLVKRFTKKILEDSIGE